MWKQRDYSIGSRIPLEMKRFKGDTNLEVMVEEAFIN